MEAPRGNKEKEEDLIFQKNETVQLNTQSNPMVFDFETYGAKPLKAED